MSIMLAIQEVLGLTINAFMLYVDKQLELAFRKDFGDVLSSPDDEVC